MPRRHSRQGDRLPQTSGRDHLASVVMIFVAGEEVEGFLKSGGGRAGLSVVMADLLPGTRARLQLSTASAGRPSGAPGSPPMVAERRGHLTCGRQRTELSRWPRTPSVLAGKLALDRLKAPSRPAAGSRWDFLPPQRLKDQVSGIGVVATVGAASPTIRAGSTRPARGPSHLADSGRRARDPTPEFREEKTNESFEGNVPASPDQRRQAHRSVLARSSWQIHPGLVGQVRRKSGPRPKPVRWISRRHSHPAGRGRSVLARFEWQPFPGVPLRRAGYYITILVGPIRRKRVSWALSTTWSRCIHINLKIHLVVPAMGERREDVRAGGDGRDYDSLETSGPVLVGSRPLMTGGKVLVGSGPLVTLRGSRWDSGPGRPGEFSGDLPGPGGPGTRQNTRSVTVPRACPWRLPVREGDDRPRS